MKETELIKEMFQSVAPEVNSDDPAKTGQLASFYPSPCYSQSCKVFFLYFSYIS